MLTADRLTDHQWRFCQLYLLMFLNILWTLLAGNWCCCSDLFWQKLPFSHDILRIYAIILYPFWRRSATGDHPGTHLSPSQPATMSSSPLGNHHKIMQLSEEYLLLDKYEYLLKLWDETLCLATFIFHFHIQHWTYDINRNLKRWGAMKHGPIIKHLHPQCVHSLDLDHPGAGPRLMTQRWDLSEHNGQ